MENIDLFRALCYFAVSSVQLNKLSGNELGVEWPDNKNVKDLKRVKRNVLAEVVGTPYEGLPLVPVIHLIPSAEAE